MKKLSVIVIFSLVLIPFLSSCKEKTKETTETETETETMDVNEDNENDWIVLFDGTSSEGWRGYKKDHFPEAWKIVDGTIHCIGSGRGEAGHKDGGDIIYDKKFK